MEQLSSLLQERWYILVAAVIVLFIVIKLVKTVIKWVFVLAIIAVVIYYGVTYKDKLASLQTSIGTELSNGRTELLGGIKEQAMKVVTNEIKEAKYTTNADGTYNVHTKSLQLDGKPGSNDAKVTFLGQSFTIKIDETVQSLIDQAKKNQ